MIPTKRFILWLTFWSVLAFVIAIAKHYIPFTEIDVTLVSYLKTSWQIIGGAVFALAFWDAREYKKPPSLLIRRRVSTNLSLGVWHDVELWIRHDFSHPETIVLFDDYPQGAEILYLPQTILLLPNRVSKMSYRIRPSQRGNAKFQPVHVLLTSKLGLWQFKKFCGEPTDVKVFPNFSAIGHFRLLATDNRVSLVGIKRKQRRGEGLDFHQLREYRESDEIRQIDWKASARHRKLIAKEYQDERDQQVILVLDCGRRMRSKDDDLSHFDHALNAILLLAYVALRQGDAVGLLSFSGGKRWLAPQKGVASISTITHALYDLHTSTQASDYSSVAQQLMVLQRKRSLLIMLSNVHDENSDDLTAALKLLKRRHLVLLANLRESLLENVIDNPIENFAQALQYAGTFEYLVTRKKVQERFIRSGILCLDTTPKRLPIEIVNQYLDIKRTGRL